MRLTTSCVYAHLPKGHDLNYGDGDNKDSHNDNLIERNILGVFNPMHRRKNEARIDNEGIIISYNKA